MATILISLHCGNFKAPFHIGALTNCVRIDVLLRIGWPSEKSGESIEFASKRNEHISANHDRNQVRLIHTMLRPQQCTQLGIDVRKSLRV